MGLIPLTDWAQNAHSLTVQRGQNANYVPSLDRVKPIFHCDAKSFALGTFASPNARNTNMLVSLALGDANFLRFTRRET